MGGMTQVVILQSRSGSYPRALAYLNATRPGWKHVVSSRKGGGCLAAIMSPDWRPGGAKGQMFAAAGDFGGQALREACRKADEADAQREFAQ